MKQKMIYIVLLMIAIQLPASSKECGKVLNCAVTESLLRAREKTSVVVEEPGVLSASPFSRLLFNL